MQITSKSYHNLFYPTDEEMEQSGSQTEDKPTGWATALKKVLKSKKPDGSRSLILSKAKKVKELKKIKEKRKGYGFEIDGEIKQEEKPDLEELAKSIRQHKIGERREIRKMVLSLRVKPSISDRERERTFQKIATKGMVQLFNAVRSQQKDLDERLEEAGKAEYKREKVLKKVSKKTFLDALMSGPRAKSELIDNPVKMEPVRKKLKKEEPDSDDSESHRKMWSALKDDFMANSGWNKSGESADEEVKSEDLDSD